MSEILNNQTPQRIEKPIELSKLDQAFWVLSWNVDWNVVENKNFLLKDMVAMREESLVKPDDFHEWCCTVLNNFIPNFQKSDYLA